MIDAASPPAAPHLLVPAAAAARDGRPPLAALFGADFSALSITPSRADGAPGVVRAALPRFAPWDADSGVDLAAWCVPDLGDAGAVRMAWAEAFEAITTLAGRALDACPFTIGLGGDHSVTWPIATAAAARCTRLGIVQLDVHHDVRSPERGPSNGTPIRGLIEAGAVRAADVVQLGIHPWGNRRELTAWCEKHGVRRMGLEEVSALGPMAAAGEALALLPECDAIWLTVDIDVLDRAFAPGTVAALPGGLTPAVLAALVREICADPRVRGLDVVEFDPTRDVSSITAYNAAHVVMQGLAAAAERAVTPPSQTSSP